MPANDKPSKKNKAETVVGHGRLSGCAQPSTNRSPRPALSPTLSTIAFYDPDTHDDPLPLFHLSSFIIPGLLYTPPGYLGASYNDW